jgi:hypothetical protein
LLLVEAEMILKKPDLGKQLNVSNHLYENEEGMISDTCEWRTNE